MSKVDRKVFRVATGASLAGVLTAAIILFNAGTPVHAGNLPSLSGAAANEPSAKTNLLQTQIARADNAPKANASDLAPIVNQRGAPPTSGIQNSPQGPFPYAVFAVQNSWDGEINGKWLTVYAGQIGTENMSAPADGGVALFSQPLADLDYGTGVQSLGYMTVAGLTSPLTITSVSGVLMMLSDGQGGIYTFDLSSLTFAN